ncbi:MAG: SDR family oxidoreductase [Spirochaetes bacterium]|nr:SDR family oxidoreductase [Spirochaetota bacterium]
MKEKRVAAIAGASSGIGRATAIHLARIGYAVSICARRSELIHEIADSIHKEGGEAFALKADMTDWKEAQNFIKSTVKELGSIDVLFNNVGAGIRFADFEDLTIEEINEGIAVNLTSVLYGCKAVLPVMKSRKSGHIINTSSILGKRARSGFSIYTAGKHGVEGFSRSLYNEVKKYGIKVSILSPAMVNTDWARKAGFDNPTAKGKIIEPEDIALVVQHLIELPDHITIWNVDVMALSQTLNPL